MKVHVIEQAGIKSAMRGLKTSHKKYECSFEYMLELAEKLASKDKGHNKFQRQIQVWVEIQAPLYWWKHMDTYTVGCVKQSESTMHTIMKRELTQDDFELPIYEATLRELNLDISMGHFELVINNLPDGFLQRRVVNLNYATIRNIILQRKKHKIVEWKLFIEQMLLQIEYPNLLGIGKVVR